MTTIDRRRAPLDQLLTYKQLAEWLNDSVRHLRRPVQERRFPNGEDVQACDGSSESGVGWRVAAGRARHERRTPLNNEVEFP
jgi:hypothetical protein